MNSVSRAHPPIRTSFYYGWVVVAVAFLTMAVAIPVRASFSNFFVPVVDEFGWARDDAALAFTIGFLVSILLTFCIGILMDRRGPQFTIPLFAIVVACGLVATTFTDSLIFFYATMGVLVIGGSIGIGYIVHSMFLANWFIRRRGLAVGIAFGGVGVGSLLIIPALEWVIQTEGWRAGCYVLAGLCLLVVPFNAWLGRMRPTDVGLPASADAGDGGTPGGNGADALILDRDWASRDWTLFQAMGQPRFWWLVLAIFGGLFAWYAILIHQKAYFVDLGFTPALAGTSVGLVAGFGVIGQIAVGSFSDRWGREIAWTLAMLGFIATALVLILMREQPSLALLWLSVALQGLLGYGLAAVFGSMPADLFAGKNFATIFAVISGLANIGGAISPWIMGRVYVLTGTYIWGFWMIVGVCALSILGVWMAAPRKVRRVGGAKARG